MCSFVDKSSKYRTSRALVSKGYYVWTCLVLNVMTCRYLHTGPLVLPTIHDHFHNWLDFSHALLTFLILVPHLSYLVFSSIIWRTPWSKYQRRTKGIFLTPCAQFCPTWLGFSVSIGNSTDALNKVINSPSTEDFYLMSAGVLSFLNALS